MIRPDSKLSASHRTSRYFKDVQRFNELAASLKNKNSPVFLGTQAELIHIHDGLTAQIHLLRHKPGMDPHLLSDLEDQYFSCTSLLMGSLTGKDLHHETFKMRYQKVWKRHQYLFIFILQLFCISFVLGLYMGWMMPEYATLLLSQPLMERIINQQDWFDSLRSNPLQGGFQIAINNLSVCFNIFFFSAMLGLGGFILLIFNGFHVGFIISYCARNGFQDVILDFVTTHGVLELTLIVVSCFAGMIMGREFFRSGNINFSKRFYQATKDGFIIVLGTSPWICLAAVFEAFVSPWSFVSYDIKMLIGVTLAALFWIYTLVPVFKKIGPSGRS